jgi:hypothetical protein
MVKAAPRRGPGPGSKEDLVLTPGGWRPRSNVHFVESGCHISGEGGKLAIVHT